MVRRVGPGLFLDGGGAVMADNRLAFIFFEMLRTVHTLAALGDIAGPDATGPAECFFHHRTRTNVTDFRLAVDHLLMVVTMQSLIALGNITGTQRPFLAAFLFSFTGITIDLLAGNRICIPAG